MNDSIAAEQVKIFLYVRDFVSLLLVISLCDVENNESFQKPDLFFVLRLLSILIDLCICLYGPPRVDDPMAVLALLDL